MTIKIQSSNHEREKKKDFKYGVSGSFCKPMAPREKERR